MPKPKLNFKSFADLARDYDARVKREGAPPTNRNLTREERLAWINLVRREFNAAYGLRLKPIK